jgi:histone-lysine N-methyltransferase SETMAR
MVIAAHPPYSPDLAPSDFFLFGHVEGLLRGESFEAGERLLSAVEGILRSLEKWTLTKVFLE